MSSFCTATTRQNWLPAWSPQLCFRMAAFDAAEVAASGSSFAGASTMRAKVPSVKP